MSMRAGSPVLIVEDEPDTLEAVSELLEGEGVPTLKARNGQEALAVLREGPPPALILLDVKMPVMDGVEFLKHAIQDPKISTIPIAIVTASASVEELPHRPRDAGFFIKPLNFERLLRVVRQYCG